MRVTKVAAPKSTTISSAVWVVNIAAGVSVVFREIYHVPDLAAIISRFFRDGQIQPETWWLFEDSWMEPVCGREYSIMEVDPPNGIKYWSQLCTFYYL